MTTRYRDEHYTDVARLLHQHGWPLPTREVAAADCWHTLCADFADLFAADNPNPDACLFCGEPRGPDPMCCSRDTPDTGHSYDGGFNRADFLSACGLESTPTAGKGTDLHSSHLVVKGES